MDSRPIFSCQILHKDNFSSAESNTVRWINAWQSGFTKSFFSVLSEDICFFPIGLKVLSNVPTQILQKECFQQAESKQRFNFFLVYIWGYLEFTIGLNGLPNIPSQILQKQCVKSEERARSWGERREIVRVRDLERLKFVVACSGWHGPNEQAGRMWRMLGLDQNMVAVWPMQKDKALRGVFLVLVGCFGGRFRRVLQ